MFVFSLDFTEKFYADPHKYALKLQLWILHQRYLTYVAAVKHILSNSMCKLLAPFPAKCSRISVFYFSGEGAILDRSVYSDCVFASVCNKEGFISDKGSLILE